jgi:hypothetical protein
MAYTTASLVENFLQRSLTQNEKASLAVIIPAIKIWLDKRLNSTFDLATSSTRYYDGGVMNLDIDPCTAISAVESINDDGADSYSYTTGTEYIAEPQNETVKRELRKRLSPFPRGVQRVAVTALFSEYDDGVPADIQIAATRLAAGIINSGKRENTGNVASESLEGHSITYVHPSGLSSGQSLDGLAESDPTVAAILAARGELLVDNYEPRVSPDYDDDGGLMI